MSRVLNFHSFGPYCLVIFFYKDSSLLRGCFGERISFYSMLFMLYPLLFVRNVVG